MTHVKDEVNHYEINIYLVIGAVTILNRLTGVGLFVGLGEGFFVGLGVPFDPHK
jgi:hypothetical protein